MLERGDVYRITVPVTRWERFSDGSGGRSVPNGTLTGDVHLEIDLEAIAKQLGATAIKNKGRRSIGLGGLVVVRAYNVRHDPPV